MAWRLHCIHECICGEFLVLLFIHLFFIHFITDNCLFWGHASSKIKHIWLAVGKWAIWWNYGVCTEQGTVHGIENKAQLFLARQLIPSALQKACCSLLLSHCIQPIWRCTDNNLQEYDGMPLGVHTSCMEESMARLSFDMREVPRGSTVFSWWTLSACLVLAHSLQQVDVVSKSTAAALEVNLWPGYGWQWLWKSLMKLSNKSSQDEQGYISAVHKCSGIYGTFDVVYFPGN